MRIIAFNTHIPDNLQILEYIGVETGSPSITSARGPPLWKECNAQMAEGLDAGPYWHGTALRIPEFDDDKRISW